MPNSRLLVGKLQGDKKRMCLSRFTQLPSQLDCPPWWGSFATFFSIETRRSLKPSVKRKIVWVWEFGFFLLAIDRFSWQRMCLMMHKQVRNDMATISYFDLCQLGMTRLCKIIAGPHSSIIKWRSRALNFLEFPNSPLQGGRDVASVLLAP